MRFPLILAATALVALAPSAAWAHAHLEHAEPAAGAMIAGAPSDLQLAFSEGVVPSLSSVRVTTGAGAAVAAGKPAADASSPKLLRVHLETPLAPGAYVVRWHVVAADTHATSGTYKFTVK